MKKNYLAPKCLAHDMGTESNLLVESMGVGLGQPGDNAESRMRNGIEEKHVEYGNLW